MKTVMQASFKTCAQFHIERPRLSQLFMNAVNYPLVMICAGAGYGKTSAVHDFVQDYQVTTTWIQLSERDNVGSRFWENYTHSVAQVNKPLAAAIGKLGFPDTQDKVNQYLTLLRDFTEIKQRIIVMDDVHLIEDSSVLCFLERAFQNIPLGTSLFLISRSVPRINTAGLISKGRMFTVSESDLRFTETELAQCFRGQKNLLLPNSLREIMEDTEGWAFAINLIARSYQKAPGYGGYLRNAMKINVFQLMETEIWNGVSKRLQRFLIRLSLIDHLSVDLIAFLAGGDRELIAEFERQNAYIRRDNYINAYLIHHLFLEFLSQKQDLLTEDEKRKTYAIAGDWCNRNGFKIDAMTYYEKTGDYESIVSIFFSLPTQIPADIARYAAQIFGRIPPEAFDRVDYLAVMHVRSIICIGRWKEAFALMTDYEARYLRLPADNTLRIHNLGGIYFWWSVMRLLMCTTDNRYDFDLYYAKLDECLSTVSAEPVKLPVYYPFGAWINLAGSAKKGAPQEFIHAFSRAVHHRSHCLNSAKTGIDDLARGELLLYQGDIRGAEPLIARSLEQTREHRQFAAVHMALFYTMRIAVSQGDYPKMEQALRDMELQLSENDYTNRFITYDIALAWYYCVLGLPEKIPDWLKDKFSPYGHAYFMENVGNQAKARYCYLTRNYPPLLAYLGEVRQREAILYGRVEMLAMEACVYNKMKDKAKALAVLQEAYETAAPNGLHMPFIELGKDMRTLTSSALKESSCTIPKPWLETVNRKSASYAKRHAHITAEYKQANNTEKDIALSSREAEILTDLSHGLSRSEIAVSHSLSINTVKMVINMIYTKAGAENLADLIRIAVERKMV
jgi:LuxR family maltose regulon positive regulatory protein